MTTIYGRNVIKEALFANREINEIFILDTIMEKEKNLVERIKEKGIKITILKKMI